MAAGGITHASLGAEAERVAGRVGVDTEGGSLAREAGRAEGEHLRLGLVEVGDHDVDVELLREAGRAP